MNDEQKKILAKIKKCLALANSSNQQESETAMRQASALMEKYQLSESDIEMANIVENVIKSSARRNPTHHETRLASECASAFDCTVFGLYDYRAGNYSWVFVGTKSASKLASYCFDVLSRQLKRDRKQYQDNKLKRFKRRNKIALSDQFARSWVNAVTHKIRRFANPDLNRVELVNKYMQAHHSDLVPFTPRVNTGRRNDSAVENASLNGYRAGDNVNLNHGLNGGTAQNLLETAS